MSVLVVAVEGPSDCGVTAVAKLMESTVLKGTGWSIKVVLEDKNIHKDRHLGNLKIMAERHPEFMPRYLLHLMIRSSNKLKTAVQEAGPNTIILVDRSFHGYYNIQMKALYEQKIISEVDFFTYNMLYEDMEHTGLSGVLLYAPLAEEIIKIKLHNRKGETIKAFDFDRNRKLVHSQVRKANTYAQKMSEAGVPTFKLDVSKKAAELKKNIIAGLDSVIDTFNNRMNVKMRQIRTKEWGVPVPKELENNPYFYRHHLTHTVTVIPDTSQINKDDMVDLYFEGQTLVKTEFYQYSSTKNVEQPYFNDLKNLNSSSVVEAHNNNVLAGTPAAQETNALVVYKAPDAKESTKDPVKEATADNVKKLAKIPRVEKAKDLDESHISQGEPTDDDTCPAEQTLSRQSSKDMYSEEEDDAQDVAHTNASQNITELGPADMLSDQIEIVKQDQDDSRSEGELSSSQSSEDEDVKSKVADRQKAISGFGQDDASSSSESGKSSESEDDFVEDSMYAKVKSKASKTASMSKASKDEFMTADSSNLIEKIKPKPRVRPEIQKVGKSKLKLPNKHKKVEVAKVVTKTYTQTVIPTVKQPAPPQGGVIELLSSSSEKEAEESKETHKAKGKQKTVDDFNNKLAKKLAKARQKELALEADITSTQPPSVSTPAPAPQQAASGSETVKKPRVSKKRKLKEVFLTEQPEQGKRSTRNSRQTGPLTHASSEPQPKRTKGSAKTTKKSTNKTVVGELDLEHSDGGTPIVGKAPIPIQLDNNFTQQLSPIVEEEIAAAREEIMADADGHNVDGEYHALPNFV